MTAKEAQARIINPWGHRTSHCWCPCCEMDNLKVYVVGFWIIADTGQFICYYGMCETCMDYVERLPAKEKSKAVDRIQAALVNRYPELLKILPKEY